MCYLLIEVGYFIGIAKSQWVASTVVHFAGFLCNFSRQAFLLPDDKRLKLSSLREQMLASHNIGLKMLQRFAGKVISFSLAVPGCKLYIRETFKAISQLSRSSRSFACIDGDLRTEILYWHFLDEWKDCFPWRSEHSLTVSLYSDASLRSWGAVLIRDSQRLVSRDYWSIDSSEDINVLESKALLNTIVAFWAGLSNLRVDVHIDSRLLKSALDGDGCKNSAINDIVKDIFRQSRDFNFSIQTFYVPSSLNPADEPAWNLSDLDCMLTPKTWLCLEHCFGPHSFDLMSLDSNCQRNRSGNPLPHFTPWPTPGSAGVNVFANSLPARQNIYILPPFVLIGPLLRYIFSQDFHSAFTLVVPDFHTQPFWWAPLQAPIVDRLLLGRKGSSSVLLFPSRHSPQWLQRDLQWDLWAFRCVCQ